MKASDNIQNHIMTMKEFAALGDGDVAYVREISTEQAVRLMGPIPDLPSKIRLYALHSADGSCMSITDTRDLALAEAWEHDLSPVSVH
jgi:hypothetical protein